MQISIESLIKKITHEVIRELARQNISVIADGREFHEKPDVRTRTEIPDMSGYKTPVLTENHIRRLHELTGRIEIPEKTVITPKARELIKERQLKIIIN